MSENSNTSNDLNNPHDKFFKSAFSLFEIVNPLLVEFLPKTLLDKLDLESLELDPNSYITDELKESFSDLVWSCQFKNSHQKKKIAFLFEHKSYKPAFPHFQIMDYQSNAWKTQIAAKQTPVPILPIVFFHGQEKWIYEPFESYFGGIEPEFLQFVPSFNYLLINLNDYSEKRIRSIESVFLQKTLLAFKHYWDKHYFKVHVVELLFDGYNQTKNERIRLFIRILAVYLTAVSGISRQEVIEQAKQSGNNLNSKSMSIIEEFIEEGIEKGIEKGKKLNIFDAYKRGINLELIADVFGTTVQNIKEVIAELEAEQK